MINDFEKFGFGVDFVKWDCDLMKDTESCVGIMEAFSLFFLFLLSLSKIWNSAGLPDFPSSICSYCWSNS